MWSAPYKGLVKLYMLTALNKAAGLEGCVYVCVVVGVCGGGGILYVSGLASRDELAQTGLYYGCTLGHGHEVSDRDLQLLLSDTF